MERTAVVLSFEERGSGGGGGWKMYEPQTKFKINCVSKQFEKHEREWGRGEGKL